MQVKLNAKIICADGFEMSVQAHNGAYCSPREDNAEKYTAAEVGFPSRVEPMLMQWAEESSRPTDTVYGWVPVQVIINVIAKHGGMISGELPAGMPILMKQ